MVQRLKWWGGNRRKWLLEWEKPLRNEKEFEN